MRVLKKNHGMFSETVIINSTNYYQSKKIALFRKLELPIKIIKVNNFEVHGLLKQKADVDFYGIYQAKFYCIEAKQTNENYFYTKNLKIHQIEFLNEIYFLKGLAILIIHFNKENLYFKID